MRTRRSPRNQERLYKAIGRDLARAADASARKPDEPPILTIEPFTQNDHDLAAEVARRLGYTQTAYTSTSSLWGLFCLRSHKDQVIGCVVRTKELGMLFVSDLEDLRMGDLHDEEMRKMRLEQEQP